MLREDGTNIGRFKVRKLVGELKLISKQPGSHAYKMRRWNVPAPQMCWIGSSTFRRRTRRWTWHTSSGVAHRMFYFTAIRAANMAAGHSANACGATALNRA